MPRRILLIIAIAILILGAGCAKRNTAYQEAKILTLDRQIAVVGNPRDITFDDDNVYIASNQGGLSIINRNTFATKWWTEILPGGSDSQLFDVRSVAAVGPHKMLFVGEYTAADKIRIVDVNDPDSLKLIDSITGGTDALQDVHFYPIPNPADEDIVEGLFAAGRTVTYVRFNGSIYIGYEWIVENLPATASGVDMNSTHLFVAAEQRGLMIYDRANQHFAGQLALPGEAQKVKVVGNFAYIAARQGGLHIVDITNPANPVLRGSYDTTGYATSVDVSGSLAVVSSGGGGVYVFDISDPSQPVVEEILTSAGYTNSAKFMGNKVVVASRDNGVLIYSLDLPDK